MSANIFGTKPAEAPLVDALSSGACELLDATGKRPDLVYTVGERGAEYAAKILLASLELNGLGVAPKDVVRLVETAEIVSDISIHPDHRFFYEDAQRQGLTAIDFIPFLEEPRGVNG